MFLLHNQMAANIITTQYYVLLRKKSNACIFLLWDVLISLHMEDADTNEFIKLECKT